MAREERNEYGCPFREQTGVAAIKNFLEIIASLSPEHRAAFETERAERQLELESYYQAAEACFA